MLRGKTNFKTDDDPAPAIPSFGGDMTQGPTLNTSDAEDGSVSDDWQNKFITWKTVTFDTYHVFWVNNE